MQMFYNRNLIQILEILDIRKKSIIRQPDDFSHERLLEQKDSETSTSDRTGDRARKTVTCSMLFQIRPRTFSAHATAKFRDRHRR